MRANALRWNGKPGHYEVYYLTLTDPATGCGVWIRYTMLAPLAGEATCALWFALQDPRDGITARRATFAIAELQAQSDPFSLGIDEATLSDYGMAGAFEDVSWDLRWARGRAYAHVHPLLRGIASTVLVLAGADLAIDGTVEIGRRRLELLGARGGQAHLWGSKHADAWTWVHCNDLRTAEGERAEDAFVDGVSVLVPRFGREVGPNTPVVARFDGSDFRSVSPLRVLSNESTFALTGWRFAAVASGRKLIGEVDADREQLTGVRYSDPDGESAYCYNTETASMRLHVYERARQVGGWEHRATLQASGCAHFEYAQREPVPDLELHIT
jgi:hypothetical protein